MECCSFDVVRCINFFFYGMFSCFSLFFEVDGKLQFTTPLMLGQPLMVTWFGFCNLLTVHSITALPANTSCKLGIDSCARIL